LNLTLVDLPGITKVPVGDQPPDIEIQIRKMILEFISKPETIILAVSSANADIANSDALKLAMEVDPAGTRTIGVLTKLDLMDRGTNALDILTGKIIPLRLGFIGVINRSQEDILNDKPISEALETEKLFFSKHPAYRAMASRMGTPFLSKTLNAVCVYLVRSRLILQILINHIRASLPELKLKIEREIFDREKELMHYGEPPIESKSSQGAFLLNLLSKFSASYCDALEGKGRDAGTAGKLVGGARISFIFHNLFDTRLKKISPFDMLTDLDIRTAIRNATV
jgi:dynamin 1-like protein